VNEPVAALVLARQYPVHGAGDVEDQWLLVREAITTALEPLEHKLASLTVQRPVPVAQLALEQARRAAGDCTVCGRRLEASEWNVGSVCLTCADSAAAGLRRRQQEEAALREEIRTFRHAAEDAWFARMPIALFRALAGRTPGAPYVEVVSDAAADAWPRALDNACRDRHHLHPARVPTRVCSGCYMPLKSLLDPIDDRERFTCGDACDARVARLGDADYGTQCLWCNRWFRWDLPVDAPVTIPYCSPHCFWAGPEDLVDPAAPDPWPATLYLPAPPATVGQRAVAFLQQGVIRVDWTPGEGPPAWLAEGRPPGPAPVIVETGALPVGPEGLTEEAVLGAVPGTTQGLADRLGASYWQVRRILVKLRQAGLIASQTIPSVEGAGRPEVMWVKSGD